MLPKKTLTVRRYHAIVDDSTGRYVSTLDSTFTIKTTVQPAPEKALNALPQGRDYYDVYRLFPQTELRSVEVNEHNPDIVEIDGSDYEVVKLQKWQNNIIPHYEAYVSKIKR